MPSPPSVLASHRAVLARALLLAAAAWAGALAHGAEALTEAAAVRALLPSAAAAGVPVRLRGVVTYFRSPDLPDFILQDASGGVHVHQPGRGRRVQLEPGDEVEIEGTTDAAVYAPRVGAQQVRVLGRAPLPTPVRTTVEELSAGYHEGLLIEVEGVVRAAAIERSVEPHRLVLTLATPLGQVEAMVVRYAQGDEQGLVDAGVRVRGVSLRQQNRRAEPYRWLVFTHAMTDVAVLEAPPVDPFAAPRRPLGEIIGRGPQHSRHRISVRGVATLVRPGELIVLQDGDASLRVRPGSGAAPVAPGERIDAAGFVRLDGYNPTLDQALVRVDGPVGLPAPVPLALPDKLDPKALAAYDGRLVSMVGTVGEVTRRAGWLALDLRVGSWTVPASLPTDAALDPRVRPGCEVRLTGVCEVLPGSGVVLFSRRPNSVSLLVPGGAEVVVLRSAPWWTPRTLAAVLLPVAAGLAAALAWALVLRRRVGQRSRQLDQAVRARHDAEVAFAAIGAERRRLAAELHDTMEQGLTGVALQLEAARLTLVGQAGQGGPPPQLGLAQQLLAHSRLEIRRSVWDLNSQAVEECDLPGALRAIVAQGASGRAATVRVETAGAALPVPGVIAHHLGRIVQEALHNALRHGRAGEVVVDLCFAPGRLELAIGDDGAGFDPGAVAGAEAGHFGMQNMRERARRLGGELTLASTPGGGTRIAISVPLAAAP